MNRKFTLALGDNTGIVAEWLEYALEKMNDSGTFKEIEVTVRNASKDGLFTFKSVNSLDSN